MLRKIFTLSAILLFAFALSAQAEPIEIKYCTDAPPDAISGPAYAYGVVFKQVVEGESGGKYKVTLYPSSQLGKERDRIDLLKSGVLHINDASLGGMSQIYQNAYLFWIPYLFSSYDAAHWVIDNSEFMDEFKADFTEKTGLKLLDVVEVGEFMDLTNNKRPIKTPEDMKGIKFRGMDKGQIAFYKALGASGIPIAWTEVYTSLQTGVVDGQMNPPAIIIWGKLYEVQKYMTLSRHMYPVHYMLTSPKWFNSLPEADQKLVMKAHRIAARAVRGLNRIKETQNLDTLRENGMEIYQPSREEFEQFRALGQPAYVDWLAEKVDKKWIDNIIEAAAEADKKVNAELTDLN